MTDAYFFILESFLAAAFAYFVSVKTDMKRALITGLIAVKGAVAWAVISKGFSLNPRLWIYFCAFAAAAAVITELSSSLKAEKNIRGFVVLCAAMMLLALFSSGCADKKSAMPALTGELNLDYVPSKIAMRDNAEIFTGSETGNVVYIYDSVSFRKKSAIAAGYMPSDMIFNRDKLYIANKSSNSITVHDMITGKSIQAASGGEAPCALALDPARGLLYAANTGSSNLSVINLQGADIRVKEKIPVGKWPSALYLSPDRRYLYVLCKYTNTVQVIDTVKDEPVFTRIDTGISPLRFVPVSGRDIAIINEWEYAFNHQSSIILFDRVNYKMEYDIMVDGGIFDAVLSKSRKYLYVSVPLKDEIIFVDIKQRKTVFTMSLKNYLPKYLCLSKDGRTLFAACQQSRVIARIAVNGYR